MENTKTNLAKIEQEIVFVLRRPLHLRVEYFFRKRYCLIAVMVLMSAAMAKSDGKFLGIMRDAYSHGYSMVSAYLGEESTRSPLSVGIARIPAISSK